MEDKCNYTIKQSSDLAKGIAADCQFLHSKILRYTIFVVLNTFSFRKKHASLCIAEIEMIQCSKIKIYISANADTISTIVKLLSSSRHF